MHIRKDRLVLDVLERLSFEQLKSIVSDLVVREDFGLDDAILARYAYLADVGTKR